MKAIVTLLDGTRKIIKDKYPKATTFIAIEFFEEITPEDYQHLSGAVKPGKSTKVWSECETVRYSELFKKLRALIQRERG